MKDPSNRTLTFSWTNFGLTRANPQWRITQVQGPAYRVTYQYYTNDSDSVSYLNLWKVHLDPDGLDRITTFTYTSYSGENGLLASIADPLNHTISYHYTTYEYFPLGTVYVDQVTEPGTGGVPSIWYIHMAGGYPPDGNLWNPSLWLIHTRFYNSTWGDMRWYYQSWEDDSTGDGVPEVISDYQLRAVFMTAVAGFESPYLQYDNANNVVAHSTWDDFSGYWNYVVPFTHQTFTYGPHGNQLTSTLYGRNISSDVYWTTATTYYDASKYFQKSSTTDGSGNTTTFDYYDNADSNVGNRGEVGT